jgi:hypothetical protein
MKRMMIALLSLTLTMPALAQFGRTHTYKQPTNSHFGNFRQSPEMYYGLRLGAAFSTVSSDDKYLDGGSLKTGLNIGAVVGFQLGYQMPLFFETGLSYIEKGGEGRYEGAKFTYGLDYLELPLVIKYAIDVAPDCNILPFVGGYMALGIGGKIKDFGHRQAYSSFDDDGFNRFDAGIRLGCSVQYQFLYAEVGYDFGLANISHDYFDTSHTGSLFATIGVNF